MLPRIMVFFGKFWVILLPEIRYDVLVVLQVSICNLKKADNVLENWLIWECHRLIRNETCNLVRTFWMLALQLVHQAWNLVCENYLNNPFNVHVSEISNILSDKRSYISTYLIRTISAIIFSVADKITVDTFSVWTMECILGTCTDSAHKWHKSITSEKFPFLSDIFFECSL